MFSLRLAPANRSLRVGWFGLLLVVLVLSVGATLAERFPGDRPLSGWVQSVDLTGLDTLSDSIYLLGFWPIILAAGLGISAVCWRCGHRLAALFVGAAVLTQVTSTLLKVLIERPRPSVGSSSPS